MPGAIRNLATMALVAVLALVGCPSLATASLDEARSLYKEALRAYRAGKLESALSLFHRSRDADPTYPFAPFAMGRIYHELFNQETRHYQEAVEAYDHTVRLLGDHTPEEKDRALYQVLYFRGLLYLRGGDYELALASFEDFLKVYPDFDNPAEVYNALGIALYYRDQYDKAVEHFRAALARNPEYAEARFNLRSVFTRLAVYNEAVALARADEMDLALEKIARLKEFAPRYLPGRRLEVQVLERLRRDDEALQVCSQALGFDPSDPLTYPLRLEMARLLAARGEKREARALLVENLQRFPDIGDERVRRQVTDLLHELEGSP